MVTVQEYKSGKIFEYMRQIDVTGKLEKYRGDFILAYKKDLSFAIFLDELAGSLIQIGYAKEISKEDAIIVMKEGQESGRLQLISKVSGKKLELCNQSLETCSLWKDDSLKFTFAFLLSNVLSNILSESRLSRRPVR